jgi:hypothetical protein
MRPHSAWLIRPRLLGYGPEAANPKPPEEAVDEMILGVLIAQTRYLALISSQLQDRKPLTREEVVQVYKDSQKMIEDGMECARIYLGKSPPPDAKP